MTEVNYASPRAQAGSAQLEHVKCEIIYARRDSEEKGPDLYRPRYDIPFVSHETVIRDAHPIAGELSLDRQGFECIKHKTACTKLDDPETLRQNYIAEMVPFIKDHFSASRVVVPSGRLGFIHRSTEQEVYSPTAHIDYSPIAGPVAAAAEDQLLGVTIRPYSRLRIIQAWRVLSPPPQDFPLAFCDATSLRDSDIVSVSWSSEKEPDTWIKTSIVHFNPDQCWYYFPRLSKDDLVLFKGYDSDHHQKVMTAHSAFDNRLAEPNANSRVSIEARFFVYQD